MFLALSKIEPKFAITQQELANLDQMLVCSLQ